MKKRICFLLTGVIMLFSACGSKGSGQEEEILTEPEYETAALNVYEVKNKETVEDGWAVKVMEADGETVNIRYPYIENKVRGVSYWEDSIDLTFSQNNFVNMNKPKGCDSIKQTASGCESQMSYRPGCEHTEAEDSCKNPLIVTLEGENIYSTESSTSLDSPLTTEKQMAKTQQDIQAVSCALYENFYTEIPQLTIKIYGIPSSIWNKQLGEEMHFSFEQYTALLKNGEAEGFSDFDELASKRVSETGVYYIDYRQLHELGDYAQILIVLEFDKSQEYTYRFFGAAYYIVSDEETYAEWKQNNSDFFIQ